MKALVFFESSREEESLKLIFYAKKLFKNIIIFSIGEVSSQREKKWPKLDLFYQVLGKKDFNFNPFYFSKVVLDLCRKEEPDVLLALDNDFNRGFIPQVAVKYSAGYINDVSRIELDPRMLVERPIYSGKLISQIEVLKKPCFFLINSTKLSPEEFSEKNFPLDVEHISFKPFLTPIQKIFQKSSSKRDKKQLSTADRVISGGRGLGKAEHFKYIEELAGILDAAPGASRAIVDEGWVPHYMQVGQTGISVSPKLYMAFGISGAIQHLVGIQGAKIVVAVNKDAEAPIFKKSNYGLVGDVLEIIEALIKEMKVK